jgi:ubiquinone/menaquinone biosynthesis C-methylase UbiE
MELRGYQYEFSRRGTAMYDVRGREQKARTMLAVLQDFFAIPLCNLSVLDVGGSTGIIDNVLSDHFGYVVGIDIDADAINFAMHNYKKDNLSFHVGDAMSLHFVDDAFDAVICSQVYEHVPDPRKMMEEIFRVLKPGGVCYFAANNRLRWNEPHYRLPLLSVLPRPLAHLYMRIAGKNSHYHEWHFTYWGLRRLVRRFELHDYTRKIVDAPETYGASYMLKRGTLKALVASVVANHFYWLMPGYIWVLRKPGGDIAQQLVAGGLPASGSSP